VHTGVWWGDLRERDHLEDQHINEMMISKFISETGYKGMHWINLAQARDKSRACVKMVMNPQDPENVDNMTCCETSRFSGRTLVCGVNFYHGSTTPVGQGQGLLAVVAPQSHTV